MKSTCTCKGSRPSKNTVSTSSQLKSSSEDGRVSPIHHGSNVKNMGRNLMCGERCNVRSVIQLLKLKQILRARALETEGSS